jgi:predicted AlkP superfamily pyrophosphatase or phosphodiesterase
LGSAQHVSRAMSVPLRLFSCLPCFSCHPRPHSHTLTHSYTAFALSTYHHLPTGLKQLPIFCTYVFQPLTIINYLVILHVTILETFIVCLVLN